QALDQLPESESYVSVISQVDRSRQMAAAKQMLNSGQEAEVRTGISRLFELLQDDPEDPEIYPFLVQTARARTPHLDDIRGRLQAVAGRGSNAAKRALE